MNSLHCVCSIRVVTSKWEYLKEKCDYFKNIKKRNKKKHFVWIREILKGDEQGLSYWVNLRVEEHNFQIFYEWMFLILKVC